MLNNEKQQYLEGPWNRVTGDSPLTQTELGDWKEDLGKMYGEANWQASPNKQNPDSYDIVVSPDRQSIYAGVARNVDRTGKLGEFSADHSVVKAFLGQLAIGDEQPLASHSAVQEWLREPLSETAQVASSEAQTQHLPAPHAETR